MMHSAHSPFLKTYHSFPIELSTIPSLSSLSSSFLSISTAHIHSSAMLQPIVCLHAQDLYLEFTRYHFGGGNGIEVSAHILLLEDVSMQKLGSTSSSSISLIDSSPIPPEHIILGPKCVLTELGREKIRVNRRDLSPRPSPRHSRFDPKYPGRHFTYTQQGVGNIRRCIVDVMDTVLLVNISPIQTFLSYILEPIGLSALRQLAHFKEQGLGPYDFKTALDVEVTILDSTIALFHHSSSTSSSTSSPLSTASTSASPPVPTFASTSTFGKNPPNAANTVSDSSALNQTYTYAFAIDLDLRYTHAWRGFLNRGPGKVEVGVALAGKTVHISPLRDLFFLSRSQGSDSIFRQRNRSSYYDDENNKKFVSLVSPVGIEFRMDTTTGGLDAEGSTLGIAMYWLVGWMSVAGL